EAGLISIIMPTYNRERFVLSAVESVFCQDYRPIELVIADDGSTDGTERKLSTWLGRLSDPRFRLVYSRKPNGGASSARNWGARRSTGEYILYLDSDDHLLPGAISRAVKLLRECDKLPYIYFRVQLSDSE